MSVFANKISKVKDISDRRRLPRLGKIRLGFKINNGKAEYPAESPFFVLPNDVARIYGFKTKVDALLKANEFNVSRKETLKFIENNYAKLSAELEIMLPVNSIEAVFPQAYKRYGSSKGVKCMGDGERAMFYDENTMKYEEIPCPCPKLKSEQNPKGECTLRGNILCMLPKVSVAGIWQLDTGSYHSTVDVNSGIDYVQALIGRFAMIPLVLRRVPMETHHNNQKQIHYTIQLILDPAIDIAVLNAMKQDNVRILSHAQYALPPVDDINPVMDKEDVIYEGEIINDASPSGHNEVADKKEAKENADNKKQAIIFEIQKYRKKIKVDTFKEIRAKYPENITEATEEQLNSFLKEMEEAAA